MSEHPIPDAALEADIAIIAKKGRGKSYTARGIAERLAAIGHRFCAVDPLDSWWGLRANADGTPGLPVIVVGGDHADLPLDPAKAEAYAAFVAGSDASVVFCVGELKRGELIRFATDFFATLFRLNRAPLTLFLEEADVFAPQQPMGDATRLLHEVDQIARRGRARGLRLVSLTQRPAKLHKDVLTQLSTLVVLGISSPQDREALKAWVEGNADRDQAREVVDSLASLQVGEGWVWAPDLGILQRVRFPANRTLDTSSTPRAGDAKVEFTLARADVSALAALVSSTLTEGAKGDRVRRATPAEWIADLEAAERRGYERGLADGQSEGLAMGLSRAAGAIDALRTGHGPLPPPEPRAPAPVHQAAPIRDVERRPSTNGAISGPGQRILNALGWWKSFGHDAPTNEQIAFIAGYSPTSTGYTNPRSALRTAGLIDYPSGGRVALSDAGRPLAESPDAPPSLEELHRRVLEKLAGPPRRILTPLIAAYPRALTNADVAAQAGYSPTSTGYTNPRSALRTLSLIDYPSSGQVRAVDWLFPKQAPS